MCTTLVIPNQNRTPQLNQQNTSKKKSTPEPAKYQRLQKLENSRRTQQKFTRPKIHTRNPHPGHPSREGMNNTLISPFLVHHITPGAHHTAEQQQNVDTHETRTDSPEPPKNLCETFKNKT
jgi:hypothetical protein